MTTIKLKYKDILDTYSNGRRSHLCHVLSDEYGYGTSLARQVVRGIAVDMYGVIYGNILYGYEILSGPKGEGLSPFEGMLPNIGGCVSKMLHDAGLEPSSMDTIEYRRKIHRVDLPDALGKMALRCDLLRALAVLHPNREFTVSN